VTVEEIKERVREIEQHAMDFEQAHALEDRLYADVLRAIAKGGHPWPAALAKAALETKAIKFARSCA